MTREDTFEIELCDAEGNLVDPVVVTVTTLIEPTEYEGPYVFYRGGAEIEDWVADKPAGSWFEMVCDDHGMEDADALVGWHWAMEILPEIEIPVRRYPGPR